MEKSGGIDPPPPYMPPGGAAFPPQPIQPAYGVGGLPPPQPGVYPSQPVGCLPATTVVVAHTTPMYGPHPAQVSCMNCHASVITETKPVGGLLTWLICGGLVLIGCWAGCCLIPFCIDDCQDIEHWCPSCKTHLGTYKRIN